jgi:hypothetical protein
MTRLEILVRLGLCVLLTRLIASCGSDLGDCDAAAAAELVYSQNGLVATKGQALTHDSCGNAAHCHSAAATGAARYGAPAHLNFDLLPVPTGWPKLIENREEAWDLVESGHMPPGSNGRKVTGDNGWSFALDRSEDAPKLPPLSSMAGKAAFRNWLACGAPLVNATSVPAWVSAGDTTPVTADFDSIYQRVLRPNCATTGCHNAAASGSLAMLDTCSAYQALLQSGACGRERMKPGDTSSLLLDKLESRMPSCGGPMPPIGPLPGENVAAIRSWISAGAPAPDCP